MPFLAPEKMKGRKKMKKVVSILCVVAMLLVFAGCGAQKKPDAVVKTYCEAMVKFDLEAMNQCLAEPNPDMDSLASDELPPELLELLKQNLQKITFAVQDVEKDAVSVSVTFQYPDLSPMVKPLMEQLMAEAFEMALSGASEEEMMETMVKVVTEQYNGFEAELTKRTVEFPCKLTEEGWKIEEVPEELAHVILGDMDQGMEEIQDILDKLG